MNWEQQEVVRLLSAKPGTTYQEADDEGKEEIRKWVKSLLQVADVDVEFTKSDGSVRQMKCTLNGEKLPPVPTPVGPVDGIVKESKQRKAPDPESIRVFDIDKQEWRSFRFDRLRKIGTSIGLA